jgi:hypothetical protein
VKLPEQAALPRAAAAQQCARAPVVAWIPVRPEPVAAMPTALAPPKQAVRERRVPVWLQQARTVPPAQKALSESAPVAIAVLESLVWRVRPTAAPASRCSGRPRSAGLPV